MLRQVQKEKDSLAELWYLMAFAYRMMGKEPAVHEAALRGLQHLRKVGGAEQARHPVTGEVLTTDDFKDIVSGYQVADGDLDKLAAVDAEEEAAGRAQAVAMTRLEQARGASAARGCERMDMGASDASEDEESEGDSEDYSMSSQ